MNVIRSSIRKRVFTYSSFSGLIPKKKFQVLIDSEGLTDQQKSIQQTAYKFAETELLPFTLSWEEKKVFPRDVIKKAAELGFLGKISFNIRDICGSIIWWIGSWCVRVVTYF